MKPEPTNRGQAVHAAKITQIISKAFIEYAEASDANPEDEDISVRAVLSGIAMALVKTAKDCEVGVEELAVNLLKMATAVDALDSLESMLEDGQADQTEVDYQSERILQDLLQRVSK
jgi:hypothetical protein